METNKESNNNEKNTNLGTPKNFLVPIMLLHLRDFNSHGYELMQKITQFGFNAVDQGNLYRILRQLEKDGKVTSEWDTESEGPAKRIYSITDAGEQYLEVWASSLANYQNMINQFFNLYQPFFPFQQHTKKTDTEK
ncbi:PadR family transcriptional regulator [Bacillus sp. FJAT-22090]|uniref:poly-beta-hydroxybutyrate-responsive repressor n=1 Tax=Bacillus sp. FJAT-22090 TaxID=1581038 RepID=UPI0006AECC66|nr:poly-beta-hydroxybutyrate-responsive repressor [Bacillus sp. FJAT-22090]ALC87813.1 PadR family transcriptional regulator [Bacillus sp. FJAT-22090]